MATLSRDASASCASLARLDGFVGQEPDMITERLDVDTYVFAQAIHVILRSVSHQDCVCHKCLLKADNAMGGHVLIICSCSFYKQYF